jgi:hypothetical protein
MTMAVGFGATHIGFGVAVLVAERREAQSRAFWAQVERLATTSTTE